MRARQNPALLAAAALCVIATAAAQGPGQTPLDLDNCGATIAGTVQVTGGLEELSGLLGNVSAQIPTLTTPGKAVTLFAPSNSAVGAFKAALEGAHPTMSQDKMKQVLAQMMRYHMLPVPLKTDKMMAGQALRTSLLGHALKVAATSPQVKLEGGAPGSEAHIGQPNIVICRSVMHIVDAVLLPAPLPDIAAGNIASPATAAVVPPSGAVPPSSAAATNKLATPPLPKPAATKGNKTSSATATTPKKTKAPTAATSAKPGLPAQPRKSSTDASAAADKKSGFVDTSTAGNKATNTTGKAATATGNTTSDAAAAAAVIRGSNSGTPSRGSAAGALCLMAAAVAAMLMLG